MSLSSLRERKGWVLPLLAALLLMLIGAWALRPWSRALRAKLFYLRASRQIDGAQFSRALSLLERSLRANPRLAYAHNDAGTIHSRWGQSEQARAAYERAISADPTFATAYNNLGFEALEKGQIEQARRAFEQAVALDPECAAAWSNLGLAERLAGRSQEAILAYKAAVRLDPDNAAAQANLGALHYGQGQLREARDHLRAALRLQPDLARAWSTLGGIALYEGDLPYARGALISVTAELDDDPLHGVLAVLARRVHPHGDELRIRRSLAFGVHTAAVLDRHLRPAQHGEQTLQPL